VANTSSVVRVTCQLNSIRLFFKILEIFIDKIKYIFILATAAPVLIFTGDAWRTEIEVVELL